MNILLAVDGSEGSQRIVQFLSKHRKLLDSKSKLTVLYVDPPMMRRIAIDMGAHELAQWHEENANRAQKKAVTALKKARLPHTVNYLVGPVAPSIVKFAEEGQYDLILMGSRGHGGLKNVLLGSVVTKVLALCKIPVLIIR